MKIINCIDILKIPKAIIKPSAMSSDEALSELKRAKDKLELGLITQATYDSLKVEYSKYIK